MKKTIHYHSQNHSKYHQNTTTTHNTACRKNTRLAVAAWLRYAA